MSRLQNGSHPATPGMPPDETTSGLLDALNAMLEAMRRLETLAQRLRDRAVNGPPLTTAESADAERELFVVREIPRYSRVASLCSAKTCDRCEIRRR